eukprot:scaffold124911_cov36-Tisochrysis_lutea.AAC.4
MKLGVYSHQQQKHTPLRRQGTRCEHEANCECGDAITRRERRVVRRDRPECVAFARGYLRIVSCRIFQQIGPKHVPTSQPVFGADRHDATRKSTQSSSECKYDMAKGEGACPVCGDPNGEKVNADKVQARKDGPAAIRRNEYVKACSQVCVTHMVHSGHAEQGDLRSEKVDL